MEEDTLVCPFCEYEQMVEPDDDLCFSTDRPYNCPGCRQTYWVTAERNTYFYTDKLSPGGPAPAASGRPRGTLGRAESEGYCEGSVAGTNPLRLTVRLDCPCNGCRNRVCLQ